MGANQNQSVNKRFFRLIAKAENTNLKEKKCIVEKVKKGDTYADGEWFSSLSGFITSITIKEIEYQGKKNKLIVIEITDNNGVCQLEFSFSGASYSIINSLQNADLTKEVDISGWVKDGKYVNCALKYTDGTKCEWAYQTDQQPKPIAYTNPSGEELKDFKNVKDFWEGLLEKVKGNAVKSNFKGVAAATNPNSSSNNEKPDARAGIITGPNGTSNADDENLPFIILILVTISAFLPF